MTKAPAEKDFWIKLHVNAYRSGLVSALGPELWATLEALAIHMDKDRKCWPSQTTLANMLGVKRRETINRRIKQLCDFRWNGRPILLKFDQDEKREGSTCEYQILVESGLTRGVRRKTQGRDSTGNHPVA